MHILHISTCRTRTDKCIQHVPTSEESIKVDCLSMCFCHQLTRSNSVRGWNCTRTTSVLLIYPDRIIACTSCTSCTSCTPCTSSNCGQSHRLLDHVLLLFNQLFCLVTFCDRSGLPTLNVAHRHHHHHYAHLHCHNYHQYVLKIVINWSYYSYNYQRPSRKYLFSWMLTHCHSSWNIKYLREAGYNN